MNRRMRRLSANLQHQKDTEKERARKMAEEMMQAQHHKMQDMYAREDRRREEERRLETSERRRRLQEWRDKLLGILYGVTPEEWAKQSTARPTSRRTTPDDHKHADSH